MSFLTEMNRRDAVLARKVRETTDRVAQIEAEVVRARQIVELRKRSLEMDRKELQRKMAESRRLVAQLSGRIEQIQTEISLMRPLAVCPVGGPHAVSDNFGDPRPEPGGGFHWHQGDDIMAASGTPILAPFDGVASVSHSFLGGLGVYVHGEYGFVYNAHLSQLGTLGPVQVGDVHWVCRVDRPLERPTRPLRVAPRERKGGRPLRLPDARLQRPAVTF